MSPRAPHPCAADLLGSCLAWRELFCKNLTGRHSLSEHWTSMLFSKVCFEFEIQCQLGSSGKASGLVWPQLGPPFFWEGAKGGGHSLGQSALPQSPSVCLGLLRGLCPVSVTLLPSVTTPRVPQYRVMISRWSPLWQKVLETTGPGPPRLKPCDLKSLQQPLGMLPRQGRPQPLPGSVPRPAPRV